MSRSLIFLLILGLFLPTCGDGESETPEAPRPEGPAVPRGFELENPLDWEERDDLPEVALVLLSPPEAAGDLFRENVTVVVGTYPPDMTTERVLELTERDIRETQEIRGAIAFEPATVGKEPGHAATYDYVREGREFRARTQTVLADGTVFQVTCTAEKDAFQLYRADFDRIIATFKLR